MGNESLKAQYSNKLESANRLLDTIQEQLAKLIGQRRVTLGVPMEGRVKTWESIEEKIERKQLSLERIEHLDDLVGIRLILLFRSEIETVEGIIGNTFDVLTREDTADRLDNARFGYQSRHFVVQLPQRWLAIPTIADLGGLKAELQVRTVAQHIWAAASHKLQYKQEQGVPHPIQRTIYRVSALLEIVDLELDRVLDERQKYRQEIFKAKDDECLNVELLGALLDELFPQANREDDHEDYANLLDQLAAFSLLKVGDVRMILSKNREKAIQEDHRYVARHREYHSFKEGSYGDRLRRGVYLTHCGLAREALVSEFGIKFLNLLMNEVPGL